MSRAMEPDPPPSPDDRTDEQREADDAYAGWYDSLSEADKEELERELTPEEQAQVEADLRIHDADSALRFEGRHRRGWKPEDDAEQTHAHDFTKVVRAWYAEHGQGPTLRDMKDAGIPDVTVTLGGAMAKIEGMVRVHRDEPMTPNRYYPVL